ncbi:hypothetical protein ACIBI4_10430 [Streptomyces sp. NPDC050418]|uniref:hypothetical protein n=1 Tax=Streptomyces sp. NPDC050418 TaxID=3365612 RepID=UPI0037A9E56E
MGEGHAVWRLMRGDVLLGSIVVDEADFPWRYGRFTAEPEFEEVRPWFEAVLAVLEAEDYDRFDAVYASIAEELTFLAPAGPVTDFLLHIEGERAWFR